VLDPIAIVRLAAAIEEPSREAAVPAVVYGLPQERRVARRTAFVYLGRLIEENETAQLFAAPREKLTGAGLTARSG